MTRHYDRRGDAARLRYLEEDYEYAGLGSLSSSGRGFGRVGQSRGAAFRRGDERYRTFRSYYDRLDTAPSEYEDWREFLPPQRDSQEAYRAEAERRNAYSAGYATAREQSEQEMVRIAPVARRARRERIYPKGYVRSDERIREEICEALGDSGLDVSDVTITVKEGVVTLDGTVTQWGIKHAIEDYADDCGGVKEIFNAIRVVRRDQ